MKAKRERYWMPKHGSPAFRAFLKRTVPPERHELLRHLLPSHWQANLRTVMPGLHDIHETCYIEAHIPQIRNDRAEYFQLQARFRRWIKSINNIKSHESGGFIDPDFTWYKEFSPPINSSWHFDIQYKSRGFMGNIEVQLFPSGRGAIFLARITEITNRKLGRPR
jgi:hypothetical protein